MKLSTSDVNFILSYGDIGKYLIDRYNKTSLELVRYYELKVFDIPGYTQGGFDYWQWTNHEICRIIKELLKENKQ